MVPAIALNFMHLHLVAASEMHLNSMAVFKMTPWTNIYLTIMIRVNNISLRKKEKNRQREEDKNMLNLW